MVNFPWALRQLKKFNDFILANKELREFFVLGEFNFLQAYQAPIFFDLLARSGKKTLGDHDLFSNQQNPFSVRVRQLAAVFISLFSYCFLVVSRRKILIYSADRSTFPEYRCDFRMVNLYCYLFRNKIRFFEILHTVFKQDFLSLAIKRKRAIVYLEAIDVLYKLYCLFISSPKQFFDSFNLAGAEEEASLFRDLLAKYAGSIPRSKFRIRVLSRLLKLTNITTLIGPADTRNYNELVAACNANGIKTYGFQSGNISKYTVGYLDCCGFQGRIIKPEKMMVETGYWKKELIRLGTYFHSDEIEVGGNLKEDYINVTNAKSESVNEDGDIIVVIPYETIAPKKEILAYIRKILLCPRLKVIFKLRPDIARVQQIAEYGLDNVAGEIIFATDLKEIERFDIAAGTYSTFLYEIVGKLRPVAYLQTSLDYGDGLVINGLTTMLDKNDSQFCEKLHQIARLPADILDRRRKIYLTDIVPLASTLRKIFSDV